MQKEECRIKGVRRRVGGRDRTAFTLSSFCIRHSSFCISSLPLAHGDEPHDLHDLLTTWGWEPLTLIGLAVSAVLYVVGVRNVWRNAGRVGAGIRKWEATSFTLGWLALFVALVSPLHPWGKVLFSAHMTQHEILMLIAAPLVVMGRPLIAFLWAVPQSWRRRLGQVSKQRWFASGWRVLTLPLVAW